MLSVDKGDRVCNDIVNYTRVPNALPAYKNQQLYNNM